MEKDEMFNEAKRLASLRRHGILDSPQEESFDLITSFAASYFSVPISLISLVDEDREWIKSKVGTTFGEIPRKLSFCTHAIQGNDVFVVSDTLNDSFFSSHPLVLSDPNIRFYAGAPFVDRNGMKLGAICIIDRQPRTMSPSQRQMLVSLAKHVVLLIEMNKTADEKKRLIKIIQNQRHKIVTLSEIPSIENMAAEISHEIKNPLAILIGKTMQLIEQIGSDESDNTSLKEELLKLLQNEERIVKIIDGIKLLYTKQRDDLIEIISLSQVIEDSLELCRIHLIEHDIHFKLELKIDPNLKLKCRPTQLSQVIINLLENSIDAIRGKSEKWIILSASMIKDGICISIVDSGNGVEEKFLKHLMRPFFTTKKGTGTGLGLNLSKKIIEDHGGTLYYDKSSPHTCFLINLPIESR